jgi:hypothetical protein
VGCWNGVRRDFFCGVIFAAKPVFGKAIIKETMELHNKAPQGFESDMTGDCELDPAEDAERPSVHWQV